MSTEPERLQRYLVAILYADVVGFSRMTEEDEESTYRALRASLDFFTDTIEAHGGKVVNYAGDAVLAMFHSAEDALVCAAHVQIELKVRNQSLEDKSRIQFRIGLNLGDIIEDHDDIYGNDVNVAARLESFGRPGGICVSGAFYSAVIKKLPFDFEFQGEQQVKNISEPVRVYHAKLKPDAVLPEPHAKTEVVITARSRNLLFPIFSVLIAVAIVIVASVLWVPRDKGTQAEQFKPAVTENPSIIVLPFNDMSEKSDQEYFVDGITEDIITDLSHISGLKVMARNTSFRYKGEVVSPQQVGNDLNVHYLLEGSVRKQGDNLRITAQLIDTSDGFHVWAERYDRKLVEVFAVQDEVTRKIVEALAINLSKQEEKILAHEATHSFAAYDMFLQGQRNYMLRTKETNQQAQEKYRQATELDPGYARSYGGLAVAVAFSVRQNWADSPGIMLERALELAKIAVSLNKSSPQTYWALGYVHLFRKEYKEALKAIEQSIAIAPNYADGYGMLSLINNHLGNAEEAIRLIKKAMLLNPYYTWEYPWNLGRAYYSLGQYERAIEELQKALARNENAVPPRLFLAASFSQLKMKDDAEWEVDQIMVINPDFTLSHLAKAAPPFEDKEQLERVMHDLRTAGLPE